MPEGDRLTKTRRLDRVIGSARCSTGAYATESMASAAHPAAADTEAIRTTPFAKSEWEAEYATDMSYPGVSAALGEEAGAGPVSCLILHSVAEQNGVSIPERGRHHPTAETDRSAPEVRLLPPLRSPPLGRIEGRATTPAL